MGSEENVDGAMAATAAAMAKEKAEKKIRKQQRLQMMIEAAARKALQETREMENKGKKRAREKTTLRSFWDSSHSSMKRGRVGGTEAAQPASLPLVSESALDILAMGALNLEGGYGEDGSEASGTVLISSTPG